MGENTEYYMQKGSDANAVSRPFGPVFRRAPAGP